MNCLVCDSALEGKTINGLNLDVCTHCSHAWFNAGQLYLYRERAGFFTDGRPPDIATFIPANNYSPKPCPSCGSNSVELGTAGHKSVYVCRNCKGCYADITSLSDQILSFITYGVLAP